jgi:hypothetical protein
MKKILFILLLMSGVAQGQTVLDSIQWSDEIHSSSALTMMHPFEQLTISIIWKDKHLDMDVVRDSLIISGDLEYDKAAVIFLESVSYQYNQTVDSLRVLQKKFNK